MALSTTETDQLILQANQLAGSALSIAVLLAAGHPARAGSTALAIKGFIDTFLATLTAEIND